jgi:hypothetical protein
MDALLIQHHIPKTAGTSIRLVTRANFKPSELVQIDWWTEPFRGLLEREAARRPHSGARLEIPPIGRETLVETARRYYESLPQRQRVRCFMGHLPGFLIPVVTDRPVRAACMLRDPVERVVSFVRWAEWSAAQKGEDRGGFGVTRRAMRERGWTLKDVYRELGGSGALPPELSVPFGPFFNGQTRHLLASTDDARDIPFSTGEEGLDDSRERVFKLLGDLYVVGTQDRFSQSLRLFADSFGWSKIFLPRARPAPAPDQVDEVDEETRELIRAHNGLDSELHAHFSERLRQLPSVTASSRLRGTVYLRLDRVRRLRRRVTGRLGRSLAAAGRR